VNVVKLFHFGGKNEKKVHGVRFFVSVRIIACGSAAAGYRRSGSGTAA
jgi:hypothetical protein